MGWNEEAYGAALLWTGPCRCSRVTLRAHLVAELLPLWERHGLDRDRGGYWSRSTRTSGRFLTGTRPAGARTSDLLVHARRRARRGPGRVPAGRGGHGLDSCWSDSVDAPHGGWFTTTDDAARRSDRRKDCTVTRSRLLARRTTHRAFATRSSLRLARATFALVLERLRDPVCGGLLEGASEDWRPTPWPRRQNPHMHLVERCSCSPRWAGFSERCARRARSWSCSARAWVDARTGALGEHFDSSWRPLAGDEGEWSSPPSLRVGLAARPIRGARADRRDAVRWQRGSSSSGGATGVDSDGGVFDQLELSGGTLASTKRLWPQTERVKALGARSRATGDADLRRELDAGLRFCSRATSTRRRTAGTRLARDGRVLLDAQNATASTTWLTALDEAAQTLEG